MAMRPFWIEADIEGRANNLSGGPKRKDGTVTIDIMQRDKGVSTTPFRIRQYANEIDGKLLLVTDVYYQGELIKSHTTDY